MALMKHDPTPVRINYTSRDYASILEDLVNSISAITQKWVSRDQNDPGIIMIKIMSILGDMLSYNQDMMALEVYPGSVLERKNAAQVFGLIGYKMKWYRSAELDATIVNTYAEGATLPRFCTFTTTDGSVQYCNFEQYELPSNMTNNGVDIQIHLIQGRPSLPSRESGEALPKQGNAWHSIYTPNYTAEEVINNRIYLKDKNIDENHIIVIDNFNEQWAQEENIYLKNYTGKMFEFKVDEFDQPYLELINYWQEFNVKNFKIFYIISDGEAGQILANTLTKITGSIWSVSGVVDNPTYYNVSTYCRLNNYDSTFGYNPETPQEARKEAIKYVNTLDTLITLPDFERAVLRIPGVANVHATDLMNDPGVEVNCYVGDINMDGKIDETDKQLLEDYLSDPLINPLDAIQKKLADANQDGNINATDLDMMNAFLNKDMANAGKIGNTMIHDTQLLAPFQVKLYILRTEEWEGTEDQVYETMVQTALADYKVLPLDIIVDLHSVKEYYWTPTGTIYMTEPMTLDDLQDVFVNINNALRFAYGVDKINFNETRDYMDVIETIMSVDPKIRHVDLDPIKYFDEEGKEIEGSYINGKFKMEIPKGTSPNPADNLTYKITIPNTPILQGSAMLLIDENIVLRDDSNGGLPVGANSLKSPGKINYYTGELEFTLNNSPITDIVLSYEQNKKCITKFRNANTRKFWFSPESVLGQLKYNY